MCACVSSLQFYVTTTTTTTTTYPYIDESILKDEKELNMKLEAKSDPCQDGFVAGYSMTENQDLIIVRFYRNEVFLYEDAYMKVRRK